MKASIDEVSALLVTFFLMGQNIFLRTLLPSTMCLCSSLNFSDSCHGCGKEQGKLYSCVF